MYGHANNNFSVARSDPTGPLQVVRCAGVLITLLSSAEACEVLIQSALAGPTDPMDVHLCNAYTLALADRSEPYLDLLNESGLNLPDGISVAWANRLIHWRKGAPLARVRGTDLFLDMFEAGSRHELRHYLLGSTPKVLTALVGNLGRLFPDAKIVGTESPPFRELTDTERDEQYERIQQSGAQIVWVGLGTPKQDVEVSDGARRLPLVFIAVGAAFDFVAGNKAEAPVWIQRSGFEWVHRLISEPRRLWRRYLFGNLGFLWALIHRLRYNPGRLS
jgi:N-acetylglucosaminyldiphosphoundecaprenol N-acetyl-beta-D-mannosaminyltransferase